MAGWGVGGEPGPISAGHPHPTQTPQIRSINHVDKLGEESREIMHGGIKEQGAVCRAAVGLGGGLGLPLSLWRGQESWLPGWFGLLSSNHQQQPLYRV